MTNKKVFDIVQSNFFRLFKMIMKNLWSRIFCSADTTAVSPNENYPKQWMLDVNDTYQKSIRLVVGFSTALLVSPILFLKQTAVTEKTTIMSMIEKNGSDLVQYGWLFLCLSILFAVLYIFGSAKWVKLAWGETADMFSHQLGRDEVELFLDCTYGLTMAAFVAGGACMGVFMLEFLHS